MKEEKQKLVASEDKTSATEPIVFISHNRIKEGKFDSVRELFREGSTLIQADKPRTLVFLAYVNEEGTEVTFIHLFPDAEAMDLHMQGAAERAKRGYEFIEPIRLEIYGTPSTGVVDSMRKITEIHALDFIPQSLGGFIRLKPY